MLFANYNRWRRNILETISAEKYSGKVFLPVINFGGYFALKIELPHLDTIW